MSIIELVWAEQIFNTQLSFCIAFQMHCFILRWTNQTVIVDLIGQISAQRIGLSRVVTNIWCKPDLLSDVLDVNFHLLHLYAKKPLNVGLSLKECFSVINLWFYLSYILWTMFHYWNGNGSNNITDQLKPNLKPKFFEKHFVKRKRCQTKTMPVRWRT